MAKILDCQRFLIEQGFSKQSMFNYSKNKKLSISLPKYTERQKQRIIQNTRLKKIYDGFRTK